MTKIQKFFERIGLDKDTGIEHTYEFLKKVQYAAVVSIAYENLDILDKKPLCLDADSLFDKIVEMKRGGYCFEVNGLLSWFLTEAGFEVKNHFARFLRDEKEIPMRRHRVLSVKCDDGVYFCDIGIGQIAPRYPIKIEEGVVCNQFGEKYKFEKSDIHGWVLKDFRKGKWQDFLGFTEETQYEVDFIQPSFYCEQHPDSVFNKQPIIAIKTKEGRKTIDGKIYKEFASDELVRIEENISDLRFAELLGKEFNIKYSKKQCDF